LRFADAQRLAFVIAVSIVLSWLVSGDFLILKAALLLLSLLVAGFPARRAIFDERWSLFAYLSHTLRLWASGLGLWLLLALQPTLIHASGALALPAAIVLFAVLLVYSHLNDRILPWCLRATRLDDPTLDEPFRAILHRARCADPRRLRTDAPGGRWVNAFALPSRRQPTVLFTADLLEALTPAEMQAIFAHEVAHLEYFHPGRMLQRELAVGLLAFAPLLVVLLYGAQSVALAGMTWVWPLVVLIFLVALLAHNQAREHDSDLRALELGGEPEPLISALTKIHHLMKMPRRWRPEGEARMSHPSLAKRVRAIRDAAASQGMTLDETEPLPDIAVRSAGQPGEWVILTADRLHWLRAVDSETPPDPTALLSAAGDYRSLRYADLRDLRLEARGSKQRQLVVVDGRGDTFKLPIAGSDVETVKRAIERLDLKVEGTALAASQRFLNQTTQTRNARILGILTCLVGLLPPFSVPLLVAGGLLLARAATVTLAAAGAIALGAALLGARGSSALYFGGGPSTPYLIVAALMGLLLLIAAVRRGRQAADPPGAAKLTLLALGALAILYTIPGLGRLATPLPAMQLHLWARYQPGLSLLLLGLGGALFTLRPRLARVPALVAVAAAAVLVVIGSPWFRDRYGEDALAGHERRLAAPTWKPDNVRELTVAGHVTELRLAPSGGRLAARVYDWTVEDYHTASLAFRVERADGGLTEIPAIDLAFVDDDTIAILSTSPNGALLLQTLSLEPRPAVLSEIALADLDYPTLRVDAAARVWEVVAADLYEGNAVRLSGDFQSDDYEELRWTRLRPSDDSYVSSVTMNASRRALVLSQRYGDQRFSALAMMLAPLAGFASAYDVELVADSSHSRLAQTALPAWCVPPPVRRTDFVCASNDHGSSTLFWSVEGDTDQVSRLGSLPAPYYQGHLSQSGTLLVGGYGVAPVLIQLSSGTARTLDLEPNPAPVEAGPGVSAVDDDSLAASGDGLAPTDDESPVAVIERGAELSLPIVDWLLQGLMGGSYAGPTYEALALGEGVLAVAASRGEFSTVAVYRLDGWAPQP
jgi:heat shock protein HtpX